MTGAIRDGIERTEPSPDLSIDDGVSGTPTRRTRSGDVYETTVEVDGESRPVAVVRPRIQGEASTATAAYLDGVRTWAAVDDHEAVLDVLDWGESADGPWMATPRPGGGTLRGAIDEGELGVDRALGIALECARGVAHLHENRVYHHALTPGRVALDGGDARVAATGTGAALDARVGGTDALSTAYAAPEQFDPDRFGDPDARTDVYRLGAVLYEALTGRPPYEGDPAVVVEAVTDPAATPDPPSEHASAPAEVDDVVETALSTDPAERYHTVEAFATALAGLDAVAADDPGIASGAPGQWRQFGGGPAHTGHHPDFGPSAPVERFWRDDTGYHEVASAPVVADGTVYYGGDDDAIRAIDAETGQAIWTVDLPARITAAPAVADGAVYVVSDDTVYAFDADGGDERWTFSSDRIRTAPAVADGTVYAGCNDETVYALDADTGGRRWAFETEGPVSGTPAVADGTVYVGCTDGNVYALDAGTGDRRWRTDDPSKVEAAPAVRYGTVYVAAVGTVYAFDPDTGDRLWAADVDANVLRSPAVDAGTVLVGTEGAGLYALDADTGDERWVYADDRSTTAAAVAGGTVYVGTATGTIAALDPDDGSETWTVDLDERPTTAPGLGASALFVGSGEGSLFSVRSEADTPGFGTAGGDVTVPSMDALQPPAGDWTSAGATPGRTRAVGPGPTDDDRTEWTFEPDAALSPPTLTGDGLVVVGDDQATLHAIDADERELLWVAEGTDHDDREVVTDGERLYAIGDRFEEDAPGATDDRLTVLDAGSGEVLWETETDSEFRTPTAVAGVVYVADDAGIAAMDAEDGGTVWTSGVASVGAPAVGYGTVYVVGDRTVTALDAGLGAERWTADLPEFAAGPPAVGDRRVVVATDQGTLLAFDAETGEDVWTATIGDRLRCPAAIADGTVYAGTDGTVVAFDAGTGDRRWDVAFEGLLRDPLAVSDGVVYAGTDEGLYAFDGDTGDELLHRSAPGESHPGAPAVGGGSVLYVDGETVLRSVGSGPQTSGPAVDRSKTAGEEENVFDSL